MKTWKILLLCYFVTCLVYPAALFWPLVMLYTLCTEPSAFRGLLQ
jgi:hypothetical protein